MLSTLLNDILIFELMKTLYLPLGWEIHSVPSGFWTKSTDSYNI